MERRTSYVLIAVLVAVVPLTGCAFAVPHSAAGKFVEPTGGSGAVNATVGFPISKTDGTDSTQIGSFGGEGSLTLDASDSYQISVVQSPGLLSYSGLLVGEVGTARLGFIHGLGAGLYIDSGDGPEGEETTVVPGTYEAGFYVESTTGNAPVFGQFKLSQVSYFHDGNDFAPKAGDTARYLTSSLGLAATTVAGLRISPETIVQRVIPADDSEETWRLAFAVTFSADY